MKRNVDLTLDRKFSRNRNSNIQLGSLRRSVDRFNDNNARYPWGYKAINTPLYKTVVTEKCNVHALHTGNRTTRNKKKEISLYYNDICCECCGQDFRKKPWLKGKYSLCYKCDINLKTKKDKLWLRIIEEMKYKKTRENIDIITLEEILNSSNSLEL